ITRDMMLALTNIDESAHAIQYVVCRSVYNNILYHFEGVDAQTGIYRFTDVNNAGVLNDEDRTALVDTGARSFGGFQNTFRYKDWSFDFLWQFVVQKGYNALYEIGRAHV